LPFNSIEFGIFLAVALATHYLLLPKGAERGRKIFLVIASYAFYASWNPPFALLLAFSTLLDFVLALRLERTRGRAARAGLLGLSLAGNLGILGFFKYGAFAQENLHWLLGTDGTLIDVVLPVGISFYTFQTLSYSIDVYRGRQRATRSLLDFALYVSFFPQLVAGPIVRAGELLPQLSRWRAPDAAEVERGIQRIAAGLAKKVLFADGLGRYVDVVFADPSAWGGANLLLAAYAYAYQIYFDFSGYTDMAIGLAMLFGIRLPENFDRPYRATSPRDFWRRWHVSLSTWLRDYLYISLGGNRRGSLRTGLNLWITMLLGGLWHGAAWNFVLWGAYHAALLSLQRALEALPAAARIRVPRPLRQVLTFHLVALGWILFRAASLDDAGAVLRGLASAGLALTPATAQAALLLGMAATLHLLGTPQAVRRSWLTLPPWLQGLGYAIASALVFAFAPAAQRFIYFQF
jgi:D-alanyl-lipoteichoic acid acyltransferase DltB (MBOAT superfamily)